VHTLSDRYRTAATLVYKITKGARPAGLPVEQPAKFELSARFESLHELALNIPESLLRADKAIE